MAPKKILKANKAKAKAKAKPKSKAKVAIHQVNWLACVVCVLVCKIKFEFPVEYSK